MKLYAFSRQDGGFIRWIADKNECELGTVITKEDDFGKRMQCFVPLVVAEKKFYCSTVEGLGWIIFPDNNSQK